MKRTAILCFFIFASLTTSFAQTNVQDSLGLVFTIVENSPEFPGGQKALDKFLANNIEYPRKAKENSVEGTVYINFIVDKLGNIQTPTIRRGIGYGCDEEAMRVVKLMPQWKPGMQGGKNVNVYYNLPIRYKLR